MPGMRSKDFSKALKRLAKMLGRQWIVLAAVIVLAVASAFFNVLGPRVLGHGTDIIVKGSFGGGGIDFSALHHTLEQALAVYAASAVLMVSASWLLAGVIQVVWEYPVVLKPHLDAGKLVAIGITSEERMPLLPNIPTFVEQGFQEAVFTGWAIISVPAGTPKPIVDKLAKAYSATLDDPSIIKYFNDQGAAFCKAIRARSCASSSTPRTPSTRT